MRVKSAAVPMVLMTLLVAICPVRAQEQARVTIFSPQGTVKRVRQVRARFSEPMVAFGDLRTAAPFDITCAEHGTARWVDDRNWAYDFDRDLPAGIRCEFRLRESLKTLSGRDVTGQRRFAFSTGGPAIIRSHPYEGSVRIEEGQIFVLELDCDATESSVLSNAWFSVSGLSDRVGIRIVSGQQREEILKAVCRYRDELPPHVILIQSKQNFPTATKVSLVWGKGVVAQNAAIAALGQTRREWFLAGTETKLVREAAGQGDCRITYPTAGTVVALDPDIPPEQQKVLFEARSDGRRLLWLLDGRIAGTADSAMLWSPVHGKHTLSLVDETDRVIDSVTFEVRC